MANEFKVKHGLIVNGSGSTVLDIQGSQGQLFSITDSLSGSLFSVGDISGIPILEVFSDDTVKIGSYNNEAIVVSGSHATVSGSFSGSFVGDGSGLTGVSVTTPTLQQVTDQGATTTNDISVTGSLTLVDGSNYKLYLDSNEIHSQNLDLYVKASQDVVIQPGEATTAHFDASGKVGIGTTSPAATLDVNGDAFIQNNGSLLASGSGYLRTGNANGGTVLIGGDGSISYIQSQNNRLVLQTARAEDDIEFKVGESAATSSMYIDGATGNVGVNTTTPDAVFEVVTQDSNRFVRFKSPNGEERFEFETGGSGNEARLYMYDNDGTTRNIQLVAGASATSYINGGNLGIGTTSPIAKLNVVDGSDSLYFSSSLGNNFRGLNLAGANPSIRLDGSGDTFIVSSLSSGLAVWDETVGSYRLNILNNGNIGIGTTTPTEKLTVEGNISGSGTINVASSITGSDVKIDDWGSVSASLASLNAAAATIDGSGAANKVATWSDSDTLTSDTNLHWDSSNDRLGIGTDTPDDALDVAGNIRITNPNGTNPTDAGSLIFNETGTTWGTDIYGFRFNHVGDSNVLKLQSANVTTVKDIITFTRDTARVGIGTTTPTYRLQVVGADGSLPLLSLKNTGSATTEDVIMSFNRDNSDTLGFAIGIDSADNSFKIANDGDSINSNARLTIDSNGDVGIGTTTPDEKLQVEGNISGSGTINVASSITGSDVKIDDWGSVSASLASISSSIQSGDITGVTAGTGLSGGGTSGAVTLNLDFSELTDKTTDIAGTTEFILQDGTTESRKAASEIKLSNFNNDLTTFTNAVTIEANTDGILNLKQTDAGSSAGTKEAGWNYIQFLDGQGDRQGYFGIDSSGDFLFNPEITGAEVKMNRLLRVSSNIVSTGTITVGTDLTVSGGDIILSGTGRIQGIDTVSAGTDAANKTYVDNAVSGLGTIDGSGAANKVAIWSDSDTLTSDTNLHWDSTNDRLGIGTTTPDEKLQVEGNISGSGTINVASSITGSDVKIDDWGSVSASLASLEASGVTTEAVRSAGAVMDDEVTDLDGIKSLTVPNSTTISTFGASLVDDADATTARTTLGLGSAATFADTSFLRTDTSDSATGIISFTNTAQSNGLTTGAIVVYGGAGIAKNVNIGGNLNVAGESIFTAAAGGGKFLISGSLVSSMSIDVTDDMITFDAPSNSGFTFNQGSNAFIVDMANTAPTFNGYTMWHSNNDGATSGLDADLLDGNHAAAFLKVANNLSDLNNNLTARNNLGLNFLTTASISSPGADRILFYDNSTGDLNWLEAGSGLTISTTTITANNTMGDGFILEDGDGTEVQITENKEVKFVEGAGIDINWTDTSNGTDADPYDLTFTVDLTGLGLGSTANLILTDDGDGTMTPESNLKFNGSKLEVTGSADINGALFLRDDNYITRFTDTDTKFGFDTADNFSVFTNGNKVVNVGATSIGLFSGIGADTGTFTLNGASISSVSSITVDDYFGFASGYNIEYVPTTAIDFNIAATRRFRINSSGVEVTGSLSLQDLNIPGTVTLTGLSSGTEGNSLMINTSGVVSTRQLGSNAFNSNTIPTAYFSAVSVDGSSAGAEAGDTLKFVTGDNITLTLDAGNEQITVSATTASYSAGTGIDLAGSTFNLDLTEITLGAGLDSTATGLSLDLSEFTDMTAAIDGAQDELILLDNGAERRKLISEISLSEFNNDLGLGSGTVDTSGTPASTQLAIFTDSNTISGSNNVTWDGSEFNVNGSGSFDYFRVLGQSFGNATAYIDAGTGTSELILQSNTGQSRIELNPGSTTAKIETGNANDLQIGVNSTALIHLDNTDSYVGIGTTTPNAKLEVNGDISGSGNLIIDGPNLTTTKLKIHQSGTGGTDIELKPQTGVTANIHTTNASDLRLGTNSTSLIHLDNANSNVGIGTTNPTSDVKLDVFGDMRVVNFSSSPTKFKVTGNTAGSAIIELTPGSTGTQNAKILTTNAKDLILGVNNNDIITIDGTLESVGINESNPKEELDVNGNIFVSGVVTGSFYNGISALGAGTTHSIDLNTAQIFTKTLTADTQFYFSNYRTGVVKDLIVSGDYDLVFNTSQHDEINIIGAASYDGSQDNLIQVLCTDDSSNGKFWLTISRT